MPKSIPTVRCAIYTRKSTEEGLDQDFNSLHAQREAAEAYIKSQKHLGWTLVSNHYDDGGFTGGNLDRPALQQLLEDIEAHRIDCVVVYKVDRLSRSLLDFARLVDRFDQRSVSFVSVTQQFNTTSSLGRLTLNILLSFAQFEREIIGERTRDKMSAARRKGKWVGGTPVLGYDVDPGGGRLIVNEKESRRVQDTFALFLQHHSLSAVVGELARRRWKTKSWKSRNGTAHAGRAFAKASLRRLLTNAVYTGMVEHRGAMYAGEHASIIEPSVWQEVNAELRAGRRTEAGAIRAPQNALLAGLLLCRSCQRPMVPTYTAKPGRRYRYYVCQAARQNGWSACPTKSVPARMIEDSVLDRLRTALRTHETREQLNVSDADWQAFEEGHCELVRALVKEVSYDGATGAASLLLSRSEASSEAQHED
ncbi:MAG: recombinase family protein [Acidobacteriia bacterium]|nr:recombinase family protein [Terriglobia bacterium]